MTEPRDAATLILVDRSGPVPKVLLGRRHASHVFMPGKFVFPGGRVDTADTGVPSADELDPHVARQLGEDLDRPIVARTIGLAAIRETFEETGLVLGESGAATESKSAGPWQNFLQTGFQPKLSGLHFITRAITPPGYPRRFDARFLAADYASIAHQVENVVHADAELTELVWVSIPESRKFDLPMITSIALEELQDRVSAGMRRDLPVPFYRMKDFSSFDRTLLG